MVAFLRLRARAHSSELHKQLAQAQADKAALHEELGSLHGEKLRALAEVAEELTRTEAEAAQRRAAEAVVRQMESDIKSLASSNDTLRFFQDAETRRRQNELEIAQLRRQVADLEHGAHSHAAAAAAAERTAPASASKRTVRWEGADLTDPTGVRLSPPCFARARTSLLRKQRTRQCRRADVGARGEANPRHCPGGCGGDAGRESRRGRCSWRARWRR